MRRAVVDGRLPLDLAVGLDDRVPVGASGADLGRVVAVAGSTPRPSIVLDPTGHREVVHWCIGLGRKPLCGQTFRDLLERQPFG